MLSISWHILLLATINANLIFSPERIEEKQETIFLGPLLNNYDLSPHLQKQGSSKLADNIIKKAVLSFPKLPKGEKKEPINLDTNNKKILSSHKFYLNNKTFERRNLSDIIQLNFKVNANKFKINQIKTMPKVCEFKISAFGQENIILVERVTTTGIPQLDIDLTQFVKKELLSYSHISFSKVKVNIVY